MLRIWLLLSVFSCALFASVVEVRKNFKTLDKGKEIRWVYPALKVSEAKNALDADLSLFKKQGYEHAKSRFFQMDTLRRKTSGRLAALVGPDELNSDKEAFLIGLPNAIEKTYRAIQSDYPWVDEILKAYASGVNTYLNELKAVKRGFLTFDLVSFYRKAVVKNSPNYFPEPWEPKDTIAITIAFSFFQSSSLEDKLTLGTIYRKLYESTAKETEFHDLLDMRPLFPYRQAEWDKFREEVVQQDPKTSSVPLPPLFHCQNRSFPFNGCDARSRAGSNAWAVSKARLHSSVKAESILASDPHILLLNPSLFFEMALDSKSAGGSYRMRGYSVPGTPGIVIGQNENIAWGFNNAMADQDQIYIEKLNKDRTQVEFNGKPIEIKNIEHKIIVLKDGKKEEEAFTVRWVPHHGPIFSDRWKGLEDLSKDKALSYQWACANKSMEMVGSLLLNKASNWNETKKALDYYCGIAGNFVYADKEGNIGYYQHGYYPIRPWVSREHLSHIPIDGTGDFEWAGFRSKFVEVYNPESGYLAVTNDDPVGRNIKSELTDYQDYFSFKSTEGVRTKRLRQLIEEDKDGIDLSDAMRIQTDQKSLLAEILIEDLVRPGDTKGEMSSHPVGKRLLNWDFEMDAESSEPYYFALWLNALFADTFEDLIPTGVFPKFIQISAGIQTMYHRLLQEGEEDLLALNKRLIRTFDKVQERLDQQENWQKTWGDVHKLVFEGPMATLVNIYQIPRGGSFLTVDVGAYISVTPEDGSLPKHFPNNYGACFRMINLMGQENEAFGILPRGIDHLLDLDGFRGSPVELRWYAEGLYRRVVPYIER